MKEIENIEKGIKTGILKFNVRQNSSLALNEKMLKVLSEEVNNKGFVLSNCKEKSNNKKW